jgi:hypothetical protein
MISESYCALGMKARKLRACRQAMMRIIEPKGANHDEFSELSGARRRHLPGYPTAQHLTAGGLIDLLYSLESF